MESLSLPEGKLVPLPPLLQNLPDGGYLSVPSDDHEVLPVEPLKRDRLVLWEEPFK